MKEYQRIVDSIYRHVTEDLGVKDAVVAYGGWYVFVFCRNPQDEHYLSQAFREGWHGIGVVVRRHRT